MKKIAVLMSSYNGEAYIAEQIESILNQTVSDEIDLWVRDDGSTDGTIGILDEYASRGMLRLIKGESNLGPAYSFLELLRICGDYDYYAFSDQDDVWDPDKIQSGIRMLENYVTPALYYSNSRLVDRNLESLGRNVYRNPSYTDLYTIMCDANAMGCAMVMNHVLVSAFRSHESPNVVLMHDAYLSRLCVSIGGTILYDHLPHMNYRQHGNNVIGVKSRKTEAIRQRIHDITTPAKVSIATQAMELLRIYDDILSTESREWLQVVSAYKRSLGKRISLAFSRKTKYITFNMSVKIRMAILFGNL